jgi:enolase
VTSNAWVFLGPLSLVGARHVRENSKRRRCDPTIEVALREVEGVIEVRALSAYEILDSRAQPSIAVVLEIAGGEVGRSSVPSGASGGSKEATEVRDADPRRYAGRGVQRVVDHITGEIADDLRARKFELLADLDEALVNLDGTANNERLGANAIIGMSMTAAQAMAFAKGRSLWRSLTPVGVEPRLPLPPFNIIDGGAHAPDALDFQEFTIAPLGASNFAGANRAGNGSRNTTVSLKLKRPTRCHTVERNDRDLPRRNTP